jgi:hypothetical protein
LSAFEVGSLICSLQNTARTWGVTEDQKRNCWTAIRWLEKLKDGKSLIEQVELESPEIYIKEMGSAAIKDGNEDVGHKILNQIAEAAE